MLLVPLGSIAFFMLSVNTNAKQQHVLISLLLTIHCCFVVQHASHDSVCTQLYVAVHSLNTFLCHSIDCCVVHSNSICAHPDNVGSGGGCSCMLLHLQLCYIHDVASDLLRCFHLSNGTKTRHIGGVVTS